MHACLPSCCCLWRLLRGSPAGKSASRRHRPALVPLPTATAPQLLEAYKASGRAAKEVDFSADDKILAAVGAK